MPGPKPKDPALKVRRNKVDSRAELPPAAAIATPELPAGREWHPMVVEWWRDVWASPQATRWTATEKQQALMAATLLDEFHRAPSVRLSQEIRSWQAGLGLDEADRRRLQWTMPVETPAAPAKETALPKAAPERRRRVDPRRSLHLVAVNE